MDAGDAPIFSAELALTDQPEASPEFLGKEYGLLESGKNGPPWRCHFSE
jgi:hypothetical protein